MLTLHSSGSNAYGQLGNGSVDDSHTFQPCSFSGCEPNTLPPGTSQILEIANGANHTIVLLDVLERTGNHIIELWGCGDGRAGQLGPADPTESSTSIFRKIVLPLEEEGLREYSWKHVCATWETTYLVLACKEKGDVLISMGSDDFGDLGIGGRKKGKEKRPDKSFYLVPFEHLTIDGAHVEPGSVTIKSTAAGQRHVIAHVYASLMNGSKRSFVVGWGTARHGQLGDEDRNGEKLSSFYSLPKIVHLDNPDDPVLSFSLGIHHTVLLHASGRLSVLGSDRKGQLQNISLLQRVHGTGCTWNGTYILFQNVEGILQIFATGNNSHGQLGLQFSSSESQNHLHSQSDSSIVHFQQSSDYRPRRMVCGSEHVLVLLSTAGGSPGEGESISEVWGWGWNEHGNLGIGSTDDIRLPVKIWPTSHTNIQQPVSVWAGNGSSWICCKTGLL